VRLPDRLGALGERNYRLLFTGQALSQLGDQMTPVAISFAVLDQGGTARQIGLVLGAGTASMVVLLLLGGAVADRLPRRLVMLTADGLRFVVQAVASLLLLSGHWQVWQLAALEALWGVGAAFFNPALTGLLPQLLKGERLVQGNALQNLSWSLGAVIGPAFAGVLVAAGGAGTAVAVDAATFVLSASNLARLRLPSELAMQDTRTTMLSDLRAGWQAFSSRRWLWAIVIEFSLWHLLVFAPFIVLGAVIAKTRLGGAPAWGLILSAFGTGALGGGLIALRWRPRRPLLAATLATLGFVPLPALIGDAVPLTAIVPVAFVAGAGFAVFGTQWDTTLQRHIPNEVLSRVSAYDWLGSTALLPIGYVIAGPIADRVGIPAALWGSSVFMAVAVGAVLLLPEVRNLPAEPRVLPFVTEQSADSAAESNFSEPEDSPAAPGSPET
jgi:MFS family permease